MEGIYHFFLDGATWIDCTLLLREVFWCLFVTCRHFSFTHVRFLPGRSNSLRDVKCLAPFSIHKDIKNLLSEIKWYQFMPLLTGRNVKCLLSKNKIHNENVVHIWSFWNVKCQLLPGRDENICKGEKCEMWNVYWYMCSFQKWMKIICSACWSFWNLNCWMKISENAVKWLLITCYVKCLLVNKCTPSRKEWKYLHCLLIILICEMSIGKFTPSRKEWKISAVGACAIDHFQMSIDTCAPSKKWKYCTKPTNSLVTCHNSQFLLNRRLLADVPCHKYFEESDSCTKNRLFLCSLREVANNGFYNNIWRENVFVTSHQQTWRNSSSLRRCHTSSGLMRWLV